MNHRALSRVWPLALMAMIALSINGLAQQVIQRGALGRPAQVLDETQQWSTPLLVAKDADVEIYIPDITNPDWLKQNYESFRDKKQFNISMFTFYRTPSACQANQTGWGQADAAHLNACIASIGYRVRQATVDTHLKTVTLIMAAMVNKDGTIDPESVQQQTLSRTWAAVDGNTQAALVKTSAFVAEQMRIYDANMQKLR